ncbi:MAG: glycosyltransferase family 4 protein [Chthoniobacteraceae bacterium]
MPKILLIGNSDEFQYSMKLFPELLQALLRQRGIPVELIRPKTVAGRLAPWAGRLGKWLFYIDKFLIFPLILQARLLRERGETGLVVHICDHSNGMYVHRLRGVPHLVTCHDLMPIRSALGEVPQNPTSWTGRRFQALILRGLRRARMVACVSTQTRDDFIRIAQVPESRTRVILNAINYPYSPMPEGEARARVAALLGGDFPYLFHIGGDAWYKNRAGLVALYAELRRRWPWPEREIPKLVNAGPSLTREIAPFLEADPGLARDVIGLQGPDSETLRALYSRAEALVFPSWDEGFGWPIIEAQACGCRVLTTGKAPMTEVGGEAAFYLDPADVPGAAEAVLGVLRQSGAEKAASIARGLENAGRFSQDQMIGQYIRLYRELLGEVVE